MATENIAELEKDTFLVYDGNCYHVRQHAGKKNNKGVEEDTWKRVSGFGSDIHALRSYFTDYKRPKFKDTEGRTLADYVKYIEKLNIELENMLGVLKLDKK